MDVCDPNAPFEHGLNGYKRHGCRGFICRRAHNEDVSAYRARKRGETPPKRNHPAGAGPQEILTRDEIAEMGELTAAGKSLAHQAVMSAKLIDTIADTGKWHLLATTVKTLGSLMKDLHATTAPVGVGSGGAEDDDDDFLGTLGRPGQS